LRRRGVLCPRGSGGSLEHRRRAERRGADGGRGSDGLGADRRRAQHLCHLGEDGLPDRRRLELASLPALVGCGDAQTLTRVDVAQPHAASPLALLAALLPGGPESNAATRATRRLDAGARGWFYPHLVCLRWRARDLQ
jgi:hypothetical protein